MYVLDTKGKALTLGSQVYSRQILDKTQASPYRDVVLEGFQADASRPVTLLVCAFEPNKFNGFKVRAYARSATPTLSRLN